MCFFRAGKINIYMQYVPGGAVSSVISQYKNLHGTHVSRIPKGHYHIVAVEIFISGNNIIIFLRGELVFCYGCREHI